MTRNSVCGVYIFVDKNNSEFLEALHLKSDSTFNFEFSNSFVPYPRLQGLWKLNGKKVILNSTNISVLPGAIGGDTLKFNSWVYNAGHNKLKRLTSGNRLRILKKVKGHYRNFILNYQPF
jgi:hypothetical protein